MAYLTDTQAKWALYGVSGLFLLLWLKAQQDGKSMVEVAGQAAANAVVDVVKGAGGALYDAGAAVADTAVHAYLSEQEKAFINDVYVYGMAMVSTPVEQGIALSFMPSQWTKAALFAGDAWVVMKAQMAADAIHQYRQAQGIEPKPAPGFFSKLFN